MNSSEIMHPLASLSPSMEDVAVILRHLIDCMEDYRLFTDGMGNPRRLRAQMKLNGILLARAYKVQEKIHNNPQAYGLTPSEQ